jgi:hypothetical protein
MFFKQPERKKFDYTPLYYTPERDPETKQKARIRFHRTSPKNNSLILRTVIFAIIIILILYFLKKLAIFG